MTDLAIVLAAGQGTRMGSSLPKVMHEAAGRTLLAHVLHAALDAGVGALAVVVGPDAQLVREHVKATAPQAGLYEQRQRLGTAHAVLAARGALESLRPDRVLVLFGDSPMLRPSTLRRLLDALGPAEVSVAVAGFVCSDGGAYGRLLMQGDQLLAIREVRDASAEELRSRLVNGGVMALRGSDCLRLLDRIGCANAQGEYYLTDVVEQARRVGRKAVVVEVDEDEVLGVNTPEELRRIDAKLRQRSEA
jgi:bifunctional UDP-N-acetylglucosamine pyrophosphorylase/glucosamine-1-phosphate N-acetyltransferase